MACQQNISVVSWNCLADCYAHGSSVRNTLSGREGVLDWSHRSRRIAAILADVDADIVCLQEVDHYDDFYKPFLKSKLYWPVYLQREGREDGVVIAVKLNKFELVKEDKVHYDDLALAARDNLSDTQRLRFRKKNVALILLLRMRRLATDDYGRRECFTICTTHMHWNPSLPHVKLAQAKYLLERITHVRESNGLPPSASIVTGDFNSLPGSEAYRSMLNGVLFPRLTHSCRSGAVLRTFASLSSAANRDGNQCARFICDGSLVKLARWLRLLGIDAAVEDKASHTRRIQRNDFNALFDRARSEQRIIVTTSTGLSKRASCPETFLVRMPKSGRLENCLAALLNCYSVQLDPANFLSVCCKCGGAIEDCSLADERIDAAGVPSDRKLLICSQCSQVYWRSSSENGVSARAKRHAEELFSAVQESRRRSKRYLHRASSSGPPSAPDELCNCKTENAKEHCSDSNVRVVEETSRHKENGKLRLKYRSAFSVVNGSEPSSTNINGSFRGTLDYVFVSGACQVSAASLHGMPLQRGAAHQYAFPNLDWPSDHLMLHTSISLMSAAVGRRGLTRSSSCPL